MKKFYSILLLVLVAASSAIAGPITSTAAGGTWSNGATWVGGIAPGTDDDVFIVPGATVTVTADVIINSITFTGSASTARTLSVNAGVTLTVTAYITLDNAIANNTAATITGAGTINCASFKAGGTVSALTADRTTTITSSVAAWSITGDLTLRGEDNGNNQSNITFDHISGLITVGGSVILDAENDAAGSGFSSVTFDMNPGGAETGTLDLPGSTPFLIPVGGTASFMPNGIAATVIYSGSDQTVKTATYTNLSLSGSGTKTLTGITTINKDLSLSGSASATTASAFTVSGNLNVGAGSSFTIGGFNCTISGTTLVSGTLTHSSATGTKIFTGNVTIASGAVWNDDADVIAVSFGSNLQNDGTINAGTGVHTFTNNNKTFSGTSGIFIPSIAINGSRTNNGTLTVSTALSGSSTLTQGTNAVLNIGGTSGINGLTASANPNTVNYTGSGQTVKAATYHHLNFNGSGTATAAAALTINGNLTIGNGVTFNGSTFLHTITGNWNNNGGTFTSTGAGKVTFDGATQTIGGTSSTTFNILALNGAPTTVTLAINTSIAADLTLSTGDVLDLAGFSCDRTSAGGTLSLTASSVLKLSGNNFPLNFTTYTLSGTVNYYNATGGQTIYSTPAYSTLTLGNTSGTQTAGGNLSVNTLNNNTNAANILDMGTNTLTVTTVNNTGTIKTQNTSALPLSTGRTWGGTVEYDGASQTIVGGTYSNLVTAGSGIKTMAASSTVTNATIGAGTILDQAGTTITLATGSVMTINGTLNFSNAAGSLRTGNNLAATLIMGAGGAIRTIDPAGLGPVATASLQNQGTGTWNTTSIDNNGTVEYYAGAAQVVTDRNYNNLTISTTAGIKTWTLAAARTVNGSLTISASAPLTFAGGAQTLNLKGNWINNSTGVFTAASVTVNLNGSAAQTIDGSQETKFGALTINNAAGVSLNNNTTVNGLLTLTDGIVNGGSNIFTISPTATLSGASDASFIDGKVKKVGAIGAGGFEFPVGKTGVGYMTIGIANVTGATTEFTAQYVRASAAVAFGTVGLSSLGMQAVSNCEYWTLDRAVTTSNADVTLSWNAHSPCGGGSYLLDPLFGIRVVHYNTTSLQWDAHGGASPVGNATSGSVTWAGVSGFSPFALGALNGSQSELPVMFSNVKAYEKNNGVQVEWSNLTEKDLISYVVERSSNGVNYTAISQQLPRSNNNDKESYTAFDATAFSGANFYRIKVYEISGKVVISKVIRVDIGKTTQGFTLYPNPVNGNQVSVSLSTKQGQYTLKVLNTAGQEIYNQKITHAGGSMTQTIELPSLKAGVYNMMISGDNYREAKMFIVQ